MRVYLSQFFERHCASNSHGIPRGVGLSALLAELAMHPFDNFIRGLPGVYRYFRFSDDIIVFSTVHHDQIIPQIERRLPKGMTFNQSKKQDIALDEAVKGRSREQSFEYLGYKFTTQTYAASEKPRPLRVPISEKKISKLKTRVILSLKSFSRDRNFPLLRDRLAYVTGNYTVRRNGFARVGGLTHVKSGIYYNYRHSGVYELSEGTLTQTEYDTRELVALDGFLNSLLCGRSSEFVGVINKSLTAQQKKALSIYSFSQGFKHRMTVRFKSDRIAAIKLAWRHA